MSFLSVLFALSAAFILYVLIGYPAALAIWAHFSPRPILKRFVARKISIIVPVRNGENFVGAKIRSLLESDYPPGLIDILIVSDGSTDGTNEIVSSYSDPRVRLLRLPAEGKATAVTRGLAEASSDIIVLTDIRQA
ncbi:MAG: glycosyltransferase, partial [Acidobacteriota bacterium]|nr:glycosyltransferase [Acidobacteriota bacterium]